MGNIASVSWSDHLIFGEGDGRRNVEKIDVLWLVEHIAREMDVAGAVKCLLKNRYNIEMEIKHIYLHANEVMRTFQPKIVAIPFFYNSTDLAIDDYVKVWPDSLYFDLAWEEIFYRGHLKIKAPSDDFARKKVIHHSWGNFYKKYLMEHGVEEKNIFVNGNPAFQLYLDPYCKFYINRENLSLKYCLDTNKRWVFIPENYRWAFLTDNTIKKKTKTGANLDAMFAMREFARQSLAEVLKWCNGTARQYNKDLEIIFRPKPVTMVSEMEDFFKEKVGRETPKGPHFIKSGTVREWILASDIVISSFSTTLIEAAIANKPIYMVEPIPLSEAFSADWHKYVTKVRNKNEFIETCRGRIPEKLESLREWAMDEMLANGDPISNLADFMYTLLENRKKDYNLQTEKETLPISEPVNVKGKNYFNPRTHENDYFNDTDVYRIIYAWEKVLNIKNTHLALMPLSVIICTYNRQQLLKDCLDSFVEQTLDKDKFEVIVADNNSKDNTKDMVLEYCHKYPNFRYVSERKQGLSHARNKGCIEANSEYLVYVDDDVIAPSEYLQNVIDVIKKYSPDIMGGPVYPYYTSRKPGWFKDEYETKRFANESGFSRDCRITGCNFIIRKSVLGKLGMFDPNYGIVGNKLRLSEERKALEKYRQVTPADKQKVYYSLECAVKHHIPERKMRPSYFLRRAYEAGRGLAKIDIGAKIDLMTVLLHSFVILGQVVEMATRLVRRKSIGSM